MQKFLTESDSALIRMSLHIAQLEQMYVALQQKYDELEKSKEKTEKTEKK